MNVNNDIIQAANVLVKNNTSSNEKFLCIGYLRNGQSNTPAKNLSQDDFLKFSPTFSREFSRGCLKDRYE